MSVAAPGDPIGIASLLDLFDGDVASVSLLLEAARSSIVGDLRRIESATLSGDATLVVEAAHRLKGTSGSISAGRLGKASSTIERVARAGSLPDVALVGELGDAVRVVTAAVASFAQGAEAPRGTHA